jgi:hypothetical protein
MYQNNHTNVNMLNRKFLIDNDIIRLNKIDLSYNVITRKLTKKDSIVWKV